MAGLPAKAGYREAHLVREAKIWQDEAHGVSWARCGADCIIWVARSRREDIIQIRLGQAWSSPSGPMFISGPRTLKDAKRSCLLENRILCSIQTENGPGLVLMP